MQKKNIQHIKVLSLLILSVFAAFAANSADDKKGNNSCNRVLILHASHKDLDNSLLPPDTVIVNESFSFYKTHQTLILHVSGIILLLTVSLLVLSVSTIRRRRDEMNLQVTLNSIGDAVISTNINGCVTRMNPVSEQLTGWRFSDAEGKLLSEVFHIVNANTRKPVENPTEKVLKTGNIVGLANHTMLIAKDGTEYLINDSAAPIKHDDGSILGVVLVFRDVNKEYRMQAELQESTEKYRLIYETSSDAIMTINPPDWKFSSGNGKIIKIFEVKSEKDFLSLQPWQLSPEFQPDGQRSDEKAKKMIEIAMKKGENFFEWTHKKFHGDNFFATVLLNRIEYREETFLQARVSDITEKKLIEQELKNSETRYRTLLNNSLAGMFVTEIKTKQIRYANPAISTMFGYSNSELQKMKVQDFHPPDSLKFALSELKALANGEKDISLSVPFLKKNGNVILCAVSTSKALIDGVNCNIGVMIDVTEQRNAEQKLKESEAKYRTLINNSLTGVLSAEVKTKKISFANPAICKMLGYSEEKLLKMSVMDIHPAEKLEHIISEFQAQAEGKKQLTSNIPFLRKNGDIIICDVSTNNTLIDGVDSNIGVIIDVTGKREAENELLRMRKLRSIGTLAGGIAHDFNNILLGIFGNVALAKIEIKEDHPAHSLILEAEKAMKRATSLTNQLLTFAKGGAPIKQTVKMADIVKDLSSFTLAGSNVKPIIKSTKKLWLAEMDKGQIEQVISNLIINADQAMPEGGNLYITLENSEIAKNALPHLDKKQYIKLTIKDEGTGIADKHLEHIFDPYFTTKQAGNGLGLATAYSIIDKHEGYIEVSSKPGKGTTFTLYLPASPPKQSKTTVTTVTEILPSDKKGRVLIMDDEAYIRKLTEKMLIRDGFSVETAEDGRQTIEKYKKSMKSGMPFDIVLMDLTIPGGMGGKETIKKLLKIDPDAKVIVFSGYSTDPIMADYENYGFKGKLIKPFKIEELKKEMSRIMMG